MMPVLFPIKETWSTEEIHTIQRVRCLEEMLEGMLDVIQSLSQVVDAKLSRDVPNEELHQLIDIVSLKTASTLEQEIDQQIKTVGEPQAVRFVRTAMGVIWDDAITIVKRWNGYSQTERNRMIRFSKLAAFVSANRQVDRHT